MNNLDLSEYMIICDLDGTLLTSKGFVSNKAADILKHCKLSGCHIGYITARSRSKKNINLLKDLPCDFIAFYNGATIYAENQLLENNALSYQDSNYMLQQLSHDYPKIMIDVYQEPWVFSNIRCEICNRSSGEIKTCTIDNLPALDVQRIRLKSQQLTSVPLERYMTSESIFYRTISGDAIIVQKNATKGHATKIASEYFDIPTSQMIAFGDDISDIDMMNTVGTGVAMGNAHCEVKTIADFVTQTNDDNGIASWIKKYLIK